MYDVTLNNNFRFGVFMDGGNQVFVPGETYQFRQWGTHCINVPWMGDIFFIDMGDQKLNAYTNPKIPWTEKPLGGLIRYRGLDAYFRYEGSGHVTVTIDQFGSIDLHFDQGGMQISLDDMTVS